MNTLISIFIISCLKISSHARGPDYIVCETVPNNTILYRKSHDLMSTEDINFAYVKDLTHETIDNFLKHPKAMNKTGCRMTFNDEELYEETECKEFRRRNGL